VVVGEAFAPLAPLSGLHRGIAVVFLIAPGALDRRATGAQARVAPAIAAIEQEMLQKKGAARGGPKPGMKRRSLESAANLGQDAVTDIVRDALKNTKGLKFQ
jgi:hypothetical protein